MAKRTIKDVIARLHELGYNESFFTDQTTVVHVTISPKNAVVHERWPHCKGYRLPRNLQPQAAPAMTWADLAEADLCEECWSGKPLAQLLSTTSGRYMNAQAAAWAMDRMSHSLSGMVTALRSDPDHTPPKAAAQVTAARAVLAAAWSTPPYSAQAAAKLPKWPASPWNSDFAAQRDSFDSLVTAAERQLASTDDYKERLLGQVAREYQGPFSTTSLDSAPCLVTRNDRGHSFDFPKTEKLVNQIVKTFTVPHPAGRPVLLVPRYVADYLLVSLPNHPRQVTLRVTSAPSDPLQAAMAVALWDPDTDNATRDLVVAVSTSQLLVANQAPAAQSS